MKVLITGGTGLLGLNWACAVRERHEVVLATHRHRAELRGTSSIALPLEEASAVAEALERIAPDVVVHTAAMANVDECERDVDFARLQNADLARNVAQAAAGCGARLVHISTDHLFAGTGFLYTEEDTPEPLNAYARTKLLAEQWVLEACPRALVARTNFFGWGHRYRESFSDWLFYNLAAGRELTLFEDAWITPILADRLSLACHELLDLGAHGVYNVAGDERVSKYEFGVRFASAFGLPEHLVLRGKIAGLNSSATRPREMSLDNTKARARLGAPLGGLTDFFSILQQQDRAGRREELRSAVTE
jgi:dTDP-4-dehydrorhamnose reductase